MSTGLDASVDVTVGGFQLRASLAIAPGETVAVVGPNGAGKSTLVRALAGLQPIDRGRISLDGRVLDDPSSGTFVAPEARSVGVVFQQYLLFPHLSAVENVAFGLRAAKIARAEARRRAHDWLDRVGLAESASLRPAELSGGQAQRVALARALATDPALVVLDEPLAALDASARQQTRRDLRLHLAGHRGVRVLVTHDPVDAAALADSVVVLEAGRVVQRGTLADIARAPRSRYVADLVGVNLFEGDASEGRVRVGGLELTVAERVDGHVLVVVPPRAISLSLRRPEGSARNVWPASVAALDGFAERVRVQLDGPVSVVAEVTAAAVTDLGLAAGREVWAAVKATELHVDAL